jgi:hypothetical protein
VKALLMPLEQKQRQVVMKRPTWTLNIHSMHSSNIAQIWSHLRFTMKVTETLKLINSSICALEFFLSTPFPCVCVFKFSFPIVGHVFLPWPSHIPSAFWVTHMLQTQIFSVLPCD